MEKDYYTQKRIRNREFIKQIKEDNPCVICGEDRHHLLDLHHVDNDKDFTVAIAGSSTFSIEKIASEIQKCCSLCSNCHRDVHFKNDTKINEKLKTKTIKIDEYLIKERSVKSYAKKPIGQSGYRGVFLKKGRNKKYTACVNRKGIKLVKSFSDIKEAARQYDKMILEIDGPSALTNAKLGLI